MNENEFELDGKVYVANHEEGLSCSSCVFLEYPCYSWKVPPCSGADRFDGKTVIFMEKPQ